MKSAFEFYESRQQQVPPRGGKLLWISVPQDQEKVDFCTIRCCLVSQVWGQGCYPQNEGNVKYEQTLFLT